MKLALVTGSLPFGGTTTFSLYLASGLRKLGVPVEFFSFDSVHPMAEEFESVGAPVHRCDERRLIYEDRLLEVYQRLRAFQPTAVFAVLGRESFEVLRYLPAGVFRVGMLHDHLPPIYDLIRFYREDMHHVAVVSQSIADHMREHFPGMPCTYLQHGVIFYDASIQRHPNPDQPLRLLFFGRLQESQKHVRIFPALYRAFKQRGFPFVWTIHGEGPEKQFLEEHLREGVAAGDIRFSKPVRHDALPSLVAGHDVYLLTSVHEGGPLSLIEGMGRGLVPICGEIPCLVTEMITPENGFRVQREAPEQYAEAVAQLHGDRPRLEAMSAAARRTAMSDYDDVAMARRYVNFVERHWQQQPQAWPETIRVQPMAGGGLVFHPIMRSLRRMRRKLKTP